MFVREYTIKLSDTDAGGVLFFANQFRIIHDIYEEYMKKCGFDFYHILHQDELSIPIVHAECSYKCPLFLGDTFLIHMNLENIKQHSFVLNYHMTKKKFLKSLTVGRAKTVHVLIDKKQEKKVFLPENLIQVLKNL